MTLSRDLKLSDDYRLWDFVKQGICLFEGYRMGNWFERAETYLDLKVNGFSGKNKGYHGELSSDWG